ncbi:IS110 family transposase [Dysgonomonas sp. 520]|nr:IS110 family transposase [Dysgonomonas sp. 520]
MYDQKTKSDEKVYGLDVHKDSIFMYILGEDDEKIEEKFRTLIPDLDCLRDLLAFHGVDKVSMESIGIYRILYVVPTLHFT